MSARGKTIRIVEMLPKNYYIESLLQRYIVYIMAIRV